MKWRYTTESWPKNGICFASSKKNVEEDLEDLNLKIEKFATEQEDAKQLKGKIDEQLLSIQSEKEEKHWKGWKCNQKNTRRATYNAKFTGRGWRCSTNTTAGYTKKKKKKLWSKKKN